MKIKKLKPVAEPVVPYDLIPAFQFQTNEQLEQQHHKDLYCCDLRRDAFGNSKRFEYRFESDLRYIVPEKTWIIWNGTRWEQDKRNRIAEYGKYCINRLESEIVVYAGEDLRPERREWAAQCRCLRSLKEMIELSTSSLSILLEELNDPVKTKHLLNCKNGTLDLDTLKCREPHREDFITKLANVKYVPAAKCPSWIEHLKLIFAGEKPDFIPAFQEVCGYTLMDENPEQVWFLLHGDGANGKSVTLNVIAGILGDYRINTASETLTTFNRAANAVSDDLARLKGARFVTCSEAERNDRLATSLMKQLTGDDSITARTLYGKGFDFKFVGKIWFSTNNKPQIDGADYATQRRLFVIPFNNRISDKKRDPHITEKLMKEASGILNWCIEGYARYQKRGKLTRSESMARVTDEYINESDMLGEFIKERCIKDENKKTSRGIFGAAYNEWRTEREEDIVHPKTIAELLRKRGFKEDRINGIWCWLGLSLISPGNAGGDTEQEQQL